METDEQKLAAAVQAKRFDLALGQYSAEQCPRRGISRLPLRRADPKSERFILPNHQRTPRKVSAPLLDAFRSLASGQTKWPLYLYGSAGSGKTSAALVLADVAESACYQTLAGLMDLTMRHPEEADHAWAHVDRAGLVVLDEIGDREKIGDLENTVLRKLLNARECLPAVYISNFAPGVIHEIYDNRISSRLLCGTWFELTGEDRRMA